MSANNPFNKGNNKSGKQGEDAARRVQQQAGGNRSGVGQRKGKPAPKPGVERSGGSSSSGGKSSTPPGLPKNRPGLPKSGGQTSGSTRRGCGLPVGIVTLLLLLGVAVLNR